MRPVLAGILATAVVLTGAREAPAQTLRLGRPSPPELDSWTAASDLARTLDDEIESILGQVNGADERRRSVLMARANLRTLAAHLLRLADESGINGSVAFLEGWTLATGREHVDEPLEAFAVNGSLSAGLDDAVVAALTAFNDDSSPLIPRVQDPSAASLDGRLEVILAPLVDAVETVLDQEIQSGWPTRGSKPAAASPGETAQMSLAAIEARAAELPLSEVAQTSLKSIIEQLRLGLEFHEFRSEATQLTGLLDDATEAAGWYIEHVWLDQPRRDEAFVVLEAAFVQMLEKETRGSGVAALRGFLREAGVVDLVSRIGTSPRDRVSEAGLLRAILPAEALESDDREARIAEAEAVLERMIDFREMPPVEFRGPLRIIAARLEREYLDAEATLLQRMSGPIDVADPAHASLASVQNQYLEDLHRVRDLPQWVESIRSIEPRAEAGIETQTRRLAQWLLEPGRRQDAVFALEQLERQMSLFIDIPFENALRTGERDAVTVTGGQHEGLVKVIDEQRRLWAEAWARGDASSDAANRLVLLHRLCLTCADFAEVEPGTESIGALNLWAAWELPEGIVTATLSEAPNRLRLAIRAAIDGNDQEASRQLERVEADAGVVKLLGRLATLVNPHLRESSEGATSVLGQIAMPPGDDALLIEHRTRLSEICRYAIEERFARLDDRTALAGACGLFINALAGDLLEDLGERRDPLPTLIGFDGSE